MTILFTICGRAGSKGIKDKNIRTFVGKPLPFYSMSAIDLFLKKTEMQIDYDIVMNTDSEELVRLMRNQRMREIQVIARKGELCGDSIGKIAVIKDCLEQMEQRKNRVYDMIVDLDITSPLRTDADIRNVIQKHGETGADVTTSITSARRNPYFNQVKRTGHGYKKVIDSNYTARQQAVDVYDMNASLYVYSPAYLRIGKGVLDGYCECVEMFDTGILDLDHERDFELMEVIARYLFEEYDSFREVYENI